MNGAATESGASPDGEYSLALDRILADPEQPHIVFQPIADLYRGVVAGYECLSRFHAGVSATPDVWFRLAEKRGRGVELELRALQAAIRARDRLPDDTFLTINLSPDALASEAIRPILRGAGTLSRLVIEITEHTAVSDYRSLTEAVSAVRTEGGLVAVDDAGAGYASLRHVLELRPNFVKLDRSLIERIDLDPAMIAVVQMLGDFTSRLDAWLIAEGIERTEELDVLASLGVPLAQGFLLGKPDRSWTTLSEVHRERLAARRNDPGHTENVISLAELRPCVTTGSDREELRCAFLSCPGAAYWFRSTACAGQWASSGAATSMRSLSSSARRSSSGPRHPCATPPGARCSAPRRAGSTRSSAPPPQESTSASSRSSASSPPSRARSQLRAFCLRRRTPFVLL